MVFLKRATHLRQRSGTITGTWDKGMWDKGTWDKKASGTKERRWRYAGVPPGEVGSRHDSSPSSGVNVLPWGPGRVGSRHDCSPSSGVNVLPWGQGSHPEVEEWQEEEGEG